MTASAKTTTASMVLKLALFIIAILAVGYVGLSTRTIGDLWRTFDEPATTQPVE